MKRALYIILLLVLTLCACNPIDKPKPDVAFCFGVVSTETTDNRAMLNMAKPYITIDGVKYKDTKIRVEYWPKDDIDNIEIEDDYQYIEGGHILFTISNLTPDTTYDAYIVLDGGQEYGIERKEYSFTTQKKTVPQITASCGYNIEPKGLFATITLSDIVYNVDGVSKAINFVRLEYRPVGSNKWTVYDYSGTDITIELPEMGQEYLKEQTEYECRVICHPEDYKLEPATAVESKFTTTDAEVTANFSLPYLQYDETCMTATIRAFELFFDGVPSTKYTSNRPIEYSILYRIKGNEDWTEISAKQTGESFSASIHPEAIQTNASYEVQASITVGNSQCYSDIAEISTTESGAPLIPEPPIGGNTSDIAGTWHLTEWRGNEPSFDIYMDITATGGITLYQRIDSNYWEIYQSSAFITNGIISGTYTDNVAWGSSYYITVEDSIMKWVDVASEDDVSIYTRADIPEHIPTIATRSVLNVSRHL